MFWRGYAGALGWSHAGARSHIAAFTARMPRWYEWAGWAPYRESLARWVDYTNLAERYNAARLLTRGVQMGLLPVAVYDRLVPWPDPGGFGPGFYPTAYAADDALAAAVARWYTDGCPVTDPPAS